MENQKNIKQYCILLLLLLLSACGGSKAVSNDTAIQEITGRWQESWDVGKANNVTYSDVYRVQVKDNNLSIVCATQKYEFEAISFANNVLKFRLINKNKYEIRANENPTDVYLIDYVLYYDRKKNLFEGQAKTNKGADIKILWTRLI
jgi:hypothetical protein